MADKLLKSVRNILTGGFPAFGLFNAGFGYANGGAVTQLANKATGVTLNAWAGQITLNNANLGATTSVSFTVTNSRIVTGNEEVAVWMVSGFTVASYSVVVESVTAGSFVVTLRNYTAGGLAEAGVLGFAVRVAAIA